ncbi:hypothetical protein DdX_19866 [Ditylenchus destructor]|uniref:DUF5110 domain-containing protein n=1 Tax=Ditylenchus destructor TaxID=166010 RepID=A0AAD4MIZ1_9BILA|nr:hypothetical protein DdX_19866 [Ditylenchus destructor]
MRSACPRAVVRLLDRTFGGATAGKTADSVTETPRIDRLPVFVRAGAIIPRQPLVQSLSETPKGALELLVYPGDDCSGTLYLDDGKADAIARGAYLRQSFRCSTTEKGLRIDLDARQGKLKPWWREIAMTVHAVSDLGMVPLGGGRSRQEWTRAPTRSASPLPIPPRPQRSPWSVRDPPLPRATDAVRLRRLCVQPLLAERDALPAVLLYRRAGPAGRSGGRDLHGGVGMGRGPQLRGRHSGRPARAQGRARAAGRDRRRAAGAGVRACVPAAGGARLVGNGRGVRGAYRVPHRLCLHQPALSRDERAVSADSNDRAYVAGVRMLSGTLAAVVSRWARCRWAGCCSEPRLRPTLSGRGIAVRAGGGGDPRLGWHHLSRGRRSGAARTGAGMDRAQGDRGEQGVRDAQPRHGGHDRRGDDPHKSVLYYFKYFLGDEGGGQLALASMSVVSAVFGAAVDADPAARGTRALWFLAAALAMIGSRCSRCSTFIARG